MPSGGPKSIYPTVLESITHETSYSATDHILKMHDQLGRSDDKQRVTLAPATQCGAEACDTIFSSGRSRSSSYHHKCNDILIHRLCQEQR